MLKKLLLLNGLCILSVILFHATGWGFVAMFSWAHRYLPATGPSYDEHGSLSYLALRLVEQLVVFAIPAFLFVSGVFIALATGRSQPTVSWGVVGARIRSLLVPYLLWSLVLFFLLSLEGNRYSPAVYVEMLITGRTNPAYYYVPLLCQLYLLSPLLVPLARSRWLPLLAVTAVVQTTVQLLYYPALLGIDIPLLRPVVDAVPKWLFPGRIFWFSLGIVAGFRLQSFERLIVRIKWWLLGAFVILWPLGVVEWEAMLRLSGQPWVDHRETLLDSLYSAVALLCFLAFARGIAGTLSKRLEQLGGKSFGIYIVHSPVMELVSRALYHALPWLLAYQIVLQPLLIVTGLGVPLLIMAAVERSSLRSYYRYSFG